MKTVQDHLLRGDGIGPEIVAEAPQGAGRRGGRNTAFLWNTPMR